MLNPESNMTIFTHTPTSGVQHTFPRAATQFTITIVIDETQ